MLEKIRDYYEMEYSDTKRYLTMYPNNKVKTVYSAIDRCLGVAFFGQSLDVDYDEVDALYQEYKAKLENLLTF